MAQQDWNCSWPTSLAPQSFPDDLRELWVLSSLLPFFLPRVVYL
jgi:hypothetical protein